MKPKIAVVEDNIDNRLLVQAIIEDRYEISEYENGMEVVDGLGDDIPDLVLLDISLPGMDGAEVLQWVRSQERLRNLPVIALTAHAMTGDREKCLEAGCTEYAAKPLDKPKLLRTCRRLIELERTAPPFPSRGASSGENVEQDANLEQGTHED